MSLKCLKCLLKYQKMSQCLARNTQLMKKYLIQWFVCEVRVEKWFQMKTWLEYSFGVHSFGLFVCVVVGIGLIGSGFDVIVVELNFWCLIPDNGVDNKRSEHNESRHPMKHLPKLDWVIYTTRTSLTTILFPEETGGVDNSPIYNWTRNITWMSRQMVNTLAIDYY